MTTTDTGTVPRLSWDDFMAQLDWRQGEHVTMVGPTGCGKTTVALALLDRRDYVCALATKPTTRRDATMERLVRRNGWKRVRHWSDVPNIGLRRRLGVVLWPEYRTPTDEPWQAYEMGVALHDMFAQGGWCIFADELWWLSVHLGLSRSLKSIWSQGRAIGLSLIGGTQRPVDIPVMAYDQATHLFFWRDNDEYNLKRISGLNGLNSREVRSIVARLPEHDVLYVNTRGRGSMCITRAPKNS